MAKKTPAELKTEGADLAALVMTARKRPMNFALLIAKEGVVLEAHMTKGADVMRRLAKANGGGTRGIQGVMNVTGKLIEFTAEDDDVPGTLAKTTKRHLKERGLSYKVVIVLPGGARMDDGEPDEEEAEGTAKPAPRPDTAPEAAAPPAAQSPKAALTARIKALIPEVKKLVELKAEGAEKLGRALQTAGAELAKDGFDRAAQLLVAIEKAVADAKTAPNATPSGEAAALRSQLRADAAQLGGGLDDLNARATTGVTGKVAQLTRMFDALVAGEDLKKASAVLKLMQTFVQTEVGKLAEKAEDAVERVGAAVDDIKDSLTEDGRKKLELQALGYSEAEQDKIVAALATNPDAVTEAKAAVVDKAGVAPAQATALKKLAQSDPKAFLAAMKALSAMDAGGALDIAPARMQASLEAFEAARKAMTDAQAAQKAAEAAIASATLAIGKTAVALGVQRGLAAAAARALADFQAGLGDPSKLSEAARNEVVAISTRLINANETAKRALAAAQKAQADAVAARSKGVADKAAADKAITDAKTPLAAAEAGHDALESKQAMLEALTAGRLSPGAKPAFKDADKAAFLAAFAKDGKLASAAMDLAARSDDPSVVAQNVGMVAGKLADGFADAKGNKLDLPKEQLRAMSQNVLQLGALQGQEYFTGFEAYLKTGAQAQPDPYGGMADPIPGDPKAENQRRNKMALARSSGLGAAAISPDGKVDFGSDAAKAAMDHMLFHPGSLHSFTPQMTQKMAETKALFADATTGPKAQQLLGDTKLPGPQAFGQSNAKIIVAGTMGKTPETVTDLDAKGAVISAMMTPLSQGPVGSCFSTAPVRAIRETDPLRAMGEYAKIATTGAFQSQGGDPYPANLTPPLGENPLMRSWEYSVATAAAEDATSAERSSLRWGLLAPGNASRNMLAIKGIIGAAGWESTVDPSQGIVPGVKDKIQTAIASELKFEYNAGPLLNAPPGGSGDGSSTDGRYVLMYGGAAVTTEAAYLAAIKAIALTAADVPPGSPQETQIIALIDSPAFKGSILSGYGKKDPNDTSANAAKYAPWDLASGGMEAQTAKVLDGGAPERVSLITKKAATVPPQTDTQRSLDVLGAILGEHALQGGKMAPMVTLGVGAAHAFNTLPGHPSLDKIKDPDSAAKIQSELVAPAQAIAAQTIALDQTVMLYDKHLTALLSSAADADRAHLVAALGRKPTVAMTPAALLKQIEAELLPYRTVQAQRRADSYAAENEPTADTARKAVILAFFENAVKDEMKGGVCALLADQFQMPAVVVADTNWGDARDQTLFVVAGDPITGEVIFWRKDLISGKMEPLGKNWTEGPWLTVK